MSVRVEQFDGGNVVYVALDPAGVWSRSTFPHPLLTADWDSEGKLIGLSAAGPHARDLLRGLLDSLDNFEGAQELESDIEASLAA